MPHWKSMTDRDYVYAFDLQGKDTVVTIERVTAGELTAAGGRKSKKPLCYFKGKQKPLAMNATNCKTVAALFGNLTEDWVGKKITLYPTTTTMAGVECECIRIRPQVPSGPATATPEPSDNDGGQP